MARGVYFVPAMVLAASAVLSAGEHVWDQHSGREYSDHFTNEWIARVDGGNDVAAQVAANLGYRFIGQVRGFPGVYRMMKDDFPNVGKRGEPRLTQKLVKDDRVMWAEQQFAKQREKRGYQPIPPTVNGCEPRCATDELLEKNPPKLDSRHLFNDELWDHQWYLQDTRTSNDMPKMDLHVVDVYRKGVSGKGVRICVLDDGIEITHPDLQENYDPEISIDLNDEDYDPSPRYDESDSNSHGTRCAGEIAMAANNGLCGVGVAFNARIGGEGNYEICKNEQARKEMTEIDVRRFFNWILKVGIRMLDGLVSDLIEGMALRYAQDKIDIYSASWGPKDDGKTVEGPGRLALEALLNGVTNGREGKGIIFVWASGNGGSRGDDCSCDGYAASPYTLSVGSASQKGQFPWYGERCPSTLAATYSSGEYSDQMIATTDLHGSCTIKHTGTSAAAPLAAGIIALALEVNPSLTWRDVQHLVVWTSQPAPLADNTGWKINGAGFFINPSFGFGLMDAVALVSAASDWVNVPLSHMCAVQAIRRENITLSASSPVLLQFHTTGCKSNVDGLQDNSIDSNVVLEEGDEVNYLEHIELEASITYSVRGAIQIYLTSPSGTTVQLLKIRPADKSDCGFQHWRFMSVLTWGEAPEGTWELRIEDRTGSFTNHGLVGQSTVLLLRGTKAIPAYMKDGPRKYNKEYNRVHKKTEFSPQRHQEGMFETVMTEIDKEKKAETFSGKNFSENVLHSLLRRHMETRSNNKSSGFLERIITMAKSRNAGFN